MCNKAKSSFENWKKLRKKVSVQLFFAGIHYKLPDCKYIPMLGVQSMFPSAVFNLIYQAS